MRTAVRVKVRKAARWIAAAAAVPVLGGSAFAEPAPCGAHLTEMGALADPGDDGYQERGRPEDETYRCEGVYEIETSGGPTQLAVVSYTHGAISYELRRQLRLVVALAPGLPVSSERIAARALPQAEGKNYQMDAEFSADGQLVWPGEILESHGIKADQLGAYGTIARDGEQVFVPLSVRAGPRDGSAGPNDRFLLAVRYPYALSSLQWKPGWMDDAGECVGTRPFDRLGSRPGRVPVEIDLTGVSGNCLIFGLRRARADATTEHAMLRIVLPGGN